MSQTETQLPQPEDKIRLPHVMTRDSCTAPFKGHSAKTNNESSVVSPPLQTDRENHGEFKRLSGIFVISALNKSAGRESSGTTFHTAGLAQASGQERKCTI